MMNAWITAFIASAANFIWGFLDGTIFLGFFLQLLSQTIPLVAFTCALVVCMVCNQTQAFSNTFPSPLHLPRQHFPHTPNTLPLSSQTYRIGTTDTSDKLPLVHHCIFKQSQKNIYKVSF